MSESRTRPRAPGSATEAVAAARRAQPAWASTPLDRRLRVLRALRGQIAASAEALASAVGRSGGSGEAETLTAEILPLADGLKFLETAAPALLAPRRPSTRGRPAWLAGVDLEIHRQPLGTVLVIGASNYPLFLAAAQALQALAAGNAAVVKPGRGAGRALALVAELAARSGLDRLLLPVLDESPSAAREAIAAGVDRVVLTGSAATGRAVLAELAPRLTPATMELSGCDAVFVRSDADLDRVSSALAFGLRLNGGATCIAPRRVFVPHTLAGELETRLAAALRPASPAAPSGAGLGAVDHERAERMVTEALSAGARVVVGAEWLEAGRPGRRSSMPPVVLTDVPESSALLATDLLAPVSSLVAVADDEEALDRAERCPWALGAAVFGRDLEAARGLARRLRAGVVTVNDLIVPTADPRLPFGGCGASGFGRTRGAEGLLEMTQTHSIATRRTRRLRHAEPYQPGDEALFAGWLELAHGSSLRQRWSGLRHLVAAAVRRGRGAPARDPRAAEVSR